MYKDFFCFVDGLSQNDLFLRFKENSSLIFKDSMVMLISIEI